MQHVDELIGHKSGVVKIVVGNNYLYSGSYDSNVLIWEKNEIEERVENRNIMLEEDLYSTKTMVYEEVTIKKGKKKGKAKGRKRKEKTK